MGIVAVSPVFPQVSFSLEAVPGAKFPIMESASLFNFGASVSLSGHIMLFPWLGAGAEIAYDTTSLQSTDSFPLNLFGFGPSVLARYEFLPRFELLASTAAGYYIGLLNNLPSDSLYLSAKAGVSYRLVGGFSLGLSGSYSHYFGKTAESLYTAAGVNVSLSYRPEALVAAPKLRFGDPEIDNLFPVFFSWYDTNPMGKVMVVNEEGSAIESLEVSVFIKDYMDQPKICAAIPRLAAGAGREVILNALFSDRVLGITEGTKVAGEIRATYKLGQETRQVSKPITVSLYDRNASVWDDDRKAAAFVTAKDPLVMRFAKTAATAVNSADLHVFSTNVRIASAIFESLRTHGVSYVVDPKSSYVERSAQKGTVDYLQFPRQTLQYRAGDCDDLSIMMCALLESVGIETTFVTIPGHIFMAYDTGIIAAEIGSWFSDPKTLIVKDGKVWMPIEITLVRDGFKAAWLKGAEEWQDSQARGDAGFHPVRAAWDLYRPVGLPGSAEDFIIPTQDKMSAAFSSAIKLLIDRESAAIGDKLGRDLAKNPADPKLLNKMGVNYARFGFYEKAGAQFELALKKTEYPNALINLGILYLELKNPKKAITYFTRLQKKEPSNPYMLAGIVKAQAQLGNSKASDEAMAKLKTVSPELAAKTSTIPGSDGGTARAGSAATEEIGWSE